MAAPELRPDEARAADTEQVWRQVAGELRAFVAKRVASPDDADDIVQDVFVRIHRGLPGVRDSDRLLGWVYRIARNAITDHYRAAPRRREVPGDLVPEGAEMAEDPFEADEDRAAEVRRELAGCIDPILSGLAPAQREALRLTEVDGLTQAEAAGRTGVSLSGMKSRVQRGRRHALALLNDCCAFALDGRGAPIAYAPRPDGCDPC